MKNILAGLVVCATLASSLICGAGNAAPESSVLIKNGTIYDGTLSKPYVADIIVKGNKIFSIGKGLKADKAKIIDANGYIVTPGFIDVHNHSDSSFDDPAVMKSPPPDYIGFYNFIYQGVTTMVTGNCGDGLTDTASWLKTANDLNFAVNIYHLIPHGSIRLALFGKNQPDKLTPEQMQLFQKRIEKEMKNGAVGLSTGLEYSPSCLADKNELIQLCKIVKKYNGIYASHIRNENGNGTMDAIDEAIDIGRQSGLPVEISHLKLCKPFKDITSQKILGKIEDARKEGLAVTADQYPYNYSATGLTIMIPTKYVINGSIKDEYKNEEGKKLIKGEIEKKFEITGPEDVLISSYSPKKEYEGKSLKEIAVKESKDPADLYVDLVCGQVVPAGIFFGQSEDIVKEIMVKDYVMTGSDGSVVVLGVRRPHPRHFGTFPRKISKFAIQDKVISLEFAIRSMTSLPAEVFKIKNRGKIAEGYYADIAVIDLKTLKDNATTVDPNQYSQGIAYLLVNGVVEIEKFKITGKRGGKGLR